ncbi:hypothetical protein [Coralloluteibacterium thermophilus]|uniref:PH domain-containing protein n=1 Tax=Coralloluteibacterium thermophilum TaxID=2707049 RepID=A0ABV9NRL6_9GAMM
MPHTLPPLPRRLHPRRLSWFGVFLLCVGFVAVGAWMIGSGEATGWLVAVVFGIGALAALVVLLPNGAYLELDADGFVLCSLFRRRRVYWAEVEGFGLARIPFGTMVGWDYRPGYGAGRRRRAVASSLSGFQAALPDTYGLPAEELAALLEHHRLLSSQGARPGARLGRAM